ncbi:MAG: DUF1622 domain-containing protein [Crenarchaeota archaeon]|nr:DUF1622 domain-containing protein [Thermoproteota archaeon]
MSKDKRSDLTIVLLIVIGVSAFLVSLFQIRDNNFIDIFVSPVDGHSGGLFYLVIATLLTIIVDILYLFGGGIVFFGVLVTIIRFIQIKVKNPYRPSGVSRSLSGYLTLSLELFIGAEIIKTAITHSFEDLETLILIIFCRGLFSLILYLERKWHGDETETE